MPCSPRSALLAASALAAALGPLAPPATAAEPPQPVTTYLERIARLDDDPAGPRLDAVIMTNPRAAEDAADAAGKGPLAGRAVLVKDNVETLGMPTTAGSSALAGSGGWREAPLITRMRRAGGVVLGKTNLSEWANIRSSQSSSGWSAIGRQTRNPHAIDRSPCGSSSGSGAAVAAGLAWVAIGTETDGSITCPASVNGVVGFKPTVGLVSRTHVVPISSSQDTAGPIAQSVADAALLLNAIAGNDPADPATLEADKRKADFTRGLAGASLKGVRIGVLRNQVGSLPRVTALFEQALADMKAVGATLVEIDYTPDPALGRDEYAVLLHETRVTMDAYLGGLPDTVPVHSLADVVAWNRAHADTEMRWFGQDIFEEALKATDAQAYATARANALRLAGAEGIDRLMAEHRVEALVAPTTGPAWPIDLVLGDHFPDPGAGNLAAVAGYPHLTVPMGAVERLPVGLSFMAGKWQDARVLQLGAAYERARSAVLATPSFRRWGE